MLVEIANRGQKLWGSLEKIKSLARLASAFSKIVRLGVPVGAEIVNGLSLGQEGQGPFSILSTDRMDFKEMRALFDEMNALETPEAKLFKSLDNLEAVVSHNEADISTWIPLEYEENLVYGQENCEWSAWTRELREELRKDSIKCNSTLPSI